MEIIPLNNGHLDRLLEDFPKAFTTAVDPRAYFTPGSVAYCVLSDGEPVLAGGIVTLRWNRGEAWILPTQFFRSHLRSCLRELRRELPRIAFEGKFKRVQAVCVGTVSAKLFRHLDFEFEGICRKAGPQNEDCGMYARIFE
jgi:hypothetical protein